MVDLSGFDASLVEPQIPFDAIPAGKYEAMIVGSDWKPNKAGTGKYLELEFAITAGEYMDRRVWARLNLVNPNKLAMQIAQSELSAICRATGVITPRDSVELHNIPIIIKVVCKQRADTGDMTNIIKGYEPAGQHPSSPNSPPWRR